MFILECRASVGKHENCEASGFPRSLFSTDVVHNWLSKSEHKKNKSAGIWYLISISAGQNKLALEGSELHLNRLFFKSILL